MDNTEAQGRSVRHNSVIGDREELIRALYFVLGKEEPPIHISAIEIVSENIVDLRNLLLPMPSQIIDVKDVRLLYAHIMVARDIMFDFKPDESMALYGYPPLLEETLKLDGMLLSTIPYLGIDGCYDLASCLGYELSLVAHNGGNT